MRFVRSFDGLVSFALSTLFLFSVFLNFTLPSFSVSKLIFSPKNHISSDLKAYCSENSAYSESTVSEICACVNQGQSSCSNVAQGNPAVQKFEVYVNPNFYLFYIFMSAFVYQLVLRNSLDLEFETKDRDVFIAKVICIFVFVITAICSIFNHSEEISFFVLLNYLPQQAVVLFFCIILFDNVHYSSDIDNDTKQQFKLVIWNGAHRCSTLPFIALFLCSLQHTSDANTLHFVYNLLLLVSLCDLCYSILSCDIHQNNISNTDKSDETKGQAGTLRLQQTAYLSCLSALIVYTIFVMVYMPVYDDVVLEKLSLVFVIFVWILHLIYDATGLLKESPEHVRAFNVADGMLGSLRYALVIFVAWIVF